MSKTLIIRYKTALAGLIIGFHSMICAYHIISPKPFAIVRTDFVKFQLGLDAGDPKPDSVFFHIVHLDYTLHDDDWPKANASYVSAWNCKNFLDGQIRVSAVVCNGPDSLVIGYNDSIPFINIMLDRNESHKSLTYACSFLPAHQPAVETLKNMPKETFLSVNDSIQFAGLWDRDSLYMIIQSNDQHLNTIGSGYSGFLSQPRFFSNILLSDGTELCFDMLHDHNEWRRFDDYEIQMNVLGACQAYHWDIQKNEGAHCGEGISFSVQRYGTINSNFDVDSGYTFLISIPWQDFNYKPGVNREFGFELQCNDLDSENDQPFRGNWGGSQKGNNDNPSEWANMVLVKQTRGIPVWLMVGGPALLVFLLVLFSPFLRSHLTRSKRVAQNRYIREAEAYIQQNFSNPELGRKEIAEHVHLSEAYLSSLFNDKTGVHLTSFINRTRIQKAVELLETSDLSIAEIAYQVGFSFQSHFNKAFKEYTHKTPSQYRK